MPITSQPTPQDAFSHLLQQPLPALAEQLATETQKFMARQPYDERVGLALFTLAVAHASQEAWECLYRQYQPLVHSWVMQHPEARRLIAYEGDIFSFVNGSFAKFFLAMTPEKLLNSPSLAALLAYLRRCTNSVLCDEARLLRVRAREEALTDNPQEPAREDPLDGLVDAANAEQFWHILRGELRSDDERHVIWQLYGLDMKPREVYQQAPHRFSNVSDVYRTKRNIMERLRRSRRLRNKASWAG